MMLIALMCAVDSLAWGQGGLGRVTFSSGGHSTNTVTTSVGEPFGGAHSTVTFGSQQNDSVSLYGVYVPKQQTVAVSFNLFPNPATETVNFTVTGNQNAAYATKVYDAIGRLYLAQSHVDRQATYDLSRLPDGIYLFVAFDENNEKVYEQKFLKENQ